MLVRTYVLVFKEIKRSLIDTQERPPLPREDDSVINYVCCARGKTYVDR